MLPAAPPCPQSRLNVLLWPYMELEAAVTPLDSCGLSKWSPTSHTHPQDTGPLCGKADHGRPGGPPALAIRVSRSLEIPDVCALLPVHPV